MMGNNAKIEDRKRCNERFLESFDYWAMMKNLKQIVLAQKMGHHSSLISSYRAGTKRVSRDVMMDLVNVSEGALNLDYMLGLSEYRLVADIPQEEQHTDNVITAKDETIALLRGQIEILQSTIATKNDMIELLQRQIEDLRHQLSILREQETLKDFPFSTRASEPRSEPRK